jgi:hypothetical protein
MAQLGRQDPDLTRVRAQLPAAEGELSCAKGVSNDQAS